MNQKAKCRGPNLTERLCPIVAYLEYSDKPSCFIIGEDLLDHLTDKFVFKKLGRCIQYFDRNASWRMWKACFISVRRGASLGLE
jgi:hypothetical protein